MANSVWSRHAESWEPRILATLAFCTVACGVVLAAMRYRNDSREFVAARLAGPVFVLGFVLLGVALSQWHVE